VGLKALFSGSGLRHNFEMAHSGGVVDRGSERQLPTFPNTFNYSKAARLGAARVHDAAARLQPDPMLSLMPSRMQKERCAQDMWWLQHVRQRADTAQFASKYWWYIAVAKQQIEKP
jgi:hypothetical protein